MENEIIYHKKGDYLIPDLIVKNFYKNNYHIGKYGHLRLDYLNEYKKDLYTNQLIKGTLSKHLDDVEISEKILNNVSGHSIEYVKKI